MAAAAGGSTAAAALGRAAARRSASARPRGERRAGAAGAAAKAADAAAVDAAVGGASAAAMAEDMVCWAALHGLLVGLGGTDGASEPPAAGTATCHAPVSLLPTPFPAAAFRRAKAVATDFNELVDAVAADHDFLTEALVDTGTLAGDPFTARIWQIYEEARAADTAREKPRRRLELGIHRSDYMLDGESGALLQVEMNTISVSFASLGALVSRAHRHLVERFATAAAVVDGGYSLQRMPESSSLEAPADALAAAWSAYADPGAVVLFIVQPGERNAYDQRWIADMLWERHRVPAVRATLADVKAKGVVDDESGALSYNGERVAVAYFRAGYAPTDYPTEAEWDARRIVELSDCVKCPSAAYHLAGTKRVQQYLAGDGQVERFLDAAASARVRETFAGLWSLLDAEGLEAAHAAIADPSAFVLKPQREGGGNNLYGAEMAAELTKLLGDEATDAERGAYVLMQRIRPPVLRATLLREGLVLPDQEVLSELGIFSTFLRDGDNVVLNAEGGSLLRTKQASSDEGGVAAGFAVLDSPILVE